MKVLLLLLLCMLATLQWSSCDASRKFVMERMEGEGNVALLFVPKKMLLEAVDEGNGMETELMLPDEEDDEKPEIIIEEEKKNSKQQEDLNMEAFEEQMSEETKQKKDPENESNPSEAGEGDFLLEESKEEKWVAEKPKKKEKKYKTQEASTDRNLGSSTEEKWKAGVREVKTENSVMDQKVAGQLIKDTPANSDKVEAVEGFSGEASLPDTALETSKGDFLLETAEEQDGSTSLGDVTVKKKIQKTEGKGNLKAEKLEKEGSKKRSLDDEISKAKEDEFEEPRIEKEWKKGGRSKKKLSDDKGLTGEEQFADEETPADLIEMEMQGGMDDLELTASKTRKVEEEKHDNREFENGGENKQTPLKNLRTPKKPKLEVLQEADSETMGSEANEKRIKMKVKKKKDYQLESEKGLDVTSTMTKQVNKDDPDSKTKKKKKVKSNKLKKEEKSEEASKKEEFFDKANEKYPKKSNKKEKIPQKEGEESSKKDEIKEKQRTDEKTKEGLTNSKLADGSGGKDTQDLKILEVVDKKIDEAEKDLSMEEDNKHFKRSKEELLNTEKQLDLEVLDIAKEAQERAEASISVSNSVALTELADEEDDEYSDFMQDFSDLSTKFQDTAHKVADHLGPNIQKLTDTSKTYFNKANQQITESFSPLVGKQFAPFLSSLVSYGLLLIPLAVVILLFEHIRAMLSLQKVLLFVNIYLAAYFATLLLATFIMGEPMTFFYRSSASGYVHLQLLQALGYIIYLILQTIDLVLSCSSEAWSIKVSVVLQWFVAATVGFHYYVTVFHRAMALKGPHTNWKIYGIYSCAFLVLCLFARIKRVKKGYVQVGQADTDKKH